MKLTITLWDFSWYARSAPGEAFHDLDEAFRQAVDRGYIGADICERAVRASAYARSGPMRLRLIGPDQAPSTAWGTIVCSNAAPHHPMWADVELQRRLNDRFLS